MGPLQHVPLSNQRLGASPGSCHVSSGSYGNPWNSDSKDKEEGKHPLAVLLLLKDCIVFIHSDLMWQKWGNQLKTIWIVQANTLKLSKKTHGYLILLILHGYLILLTGCRLFSAYSQSNCSFVSEMLWSPTSYSLEIQQARQRLQKSDQPRLKWCIFLPY